MPFGPSWIRPTEFLRRGLLATKAPAHRFTSLPGSASRSLRRHRARAVRARRSLASRSWVRPSCSSRMQEGDAHSGPAHRRSLLDPPVSRISRGRAARRRTPEGDGSGQNARDSRWPTHDCEEALAPPPAAGSRAAHRAGRGRPLGTRPAIEQIATNLLAIAIKFGGGQTDQPHRRRSRTATRCSRVADHGIGIEPRLKERSFRPLRARGVPARNYGGLGLASSSPRRVVVAHGGTVWRHRRPRPGGHLHRPPAPSPAA
jgi:signal transduction histidine kinase